VLCFVVSLAAQGIGTVVYLLLIARLFGRLKARHATAWEALGSPSLFLNNTIGNNRLVLAWLWNRKFRDLQEAQTMRLAGTVRTLLLALAGNFAVLVLLYLVLGLHRSRP
jgi:hypothetical protein